MKINFIAERLLEERFKEASVLPLWLQVRPASTHEPSPTEKAVCGLGAS